MPAAYDKFDYPQYWKGREYEHLSEVAALSEFLEKIPKIHRMLEVGSGYGRLTSEYLYRANQVYLVDSSARLLKLARKNYKNHKHIKYVHSNIENVKNKIKYHSMDLIIMVRILHHVEDLDSFFKDVDKYLTDGGFIILEFPNKKNVKALCREILRGNFTYPLDIFPEDKNKKNDSTFPFNNYHPDVIIDLLKKNDYEIIETRSVSNIRNQFIKRHLPKDFLMFIEVKLQKILANFSFGPSMFIFARKIKY